MALKEAAISGFGGLYTEADPTSLPAGASPLCHDIDFVVGGVTIRPGLSSPFNMPSGSAGYQWLSSAALPGNLRYNIFQDTIGKLWYENLNAPVSLAQFYAGILNNARAISSHFPQREFIALSDLTVGVDQPRQWDGTNLDRVSQVGPGVGPAVPPQAPLATYNVTSITQPYTAQSINSAVWGSAIDEYHATPAANSLWILAYPNTGAEWLGDVQIGDYIYISGMGTLAGQNPNGTYAVAATGFFTDATGTMPYIMVQTLVAVSDFARGTAGGTYQKTQAVVKISNPIPSLSEVVGGNLTISGATPNSWNGLWQIQFTPTLGQLLIQATFLLSNVATYTYAIASGEAPGWQEANRYVLASKVVDQYGHVWQVITPGISGSGSPPFPAVPNSTASYVVTDTGTSIGGTVTYSGTFPNGAANALAGEVFYISGFTNPSNNGTFKCSASTTTTITVNNGSATIEGPITGSADYLGVGDNTVVWSYQAGATITITVFGTSNGNGIFNIAKQTITSATSTTFTVSITSQNFGSASEEGNAISGSANVIIIDPATKTVNTGSPGDDPIFGSAGAGGLVIPASTGDVASGQRYAICMFLTRNEFITPGSPPTSFYTTGQSTQITFNNLPIGPPDVISRIVAITGANSGIGGPYFWIPAPVTVSGTAATLGVTTVYDSTVVNDNVSTTTGPITISDTVLLNSTNVSVAANNVLNQREIGEFVKCVNYFGRGFYIGERVKVDNFVNLTFDGGSVNNLPAGWNVSSGLISDTSVVASPIVNQSLYIKNPPLPKLVQSAQNRQFSSATSVSVVLPVAPTAGNMLVFMIAGLWESGGGWDFIPPSGLTLETSANSTYEQIKIYTRTVIGGDPATWTFTLPQSYQDVNVAVFEIPGTPTLAGYSGTVSSTSPILQSSVISPVGESMVFCMFEWFGQAGSPTIPVSSISPSAYSNAFDFNSGPNGTHLGTILFGSGVSLPSSAISCSVPWYLDGLPLYAILTCAYSSTVSIINPTGTSLANLVTLSQTAYEDAFSAPIIDSDTAYSLRVSASIPAANTNGSLVIELYSPSLAQNWAFTVPFASMSTSVQEFVGAFSNPQWLPVLSDLQLRVYPFNMASGADVLVDRIEIYPTNQPVYSSQCAASYAQNYEAVDSITGILDTSNFTSEPQTDIFVFGENLIIKTLTKTFSFSGANQSGEPSTWQPREVSNTVGECGPLASDVGEEYTLDAAQTGLYIFDGGNHSKISQEIYKIWNAIYQPALNTIWVKDDIANKRILCGVPLPTPNQWLPDADVNATPLVPNVVLVMSYLGLDTGPQIAEGQSVTVSMFGGHLIWKDGRRKWTIWQIASPYANFIPRPNNSTQLLLGGAAGTGQINQLTPGLLTDNGKAIPETYMTYGFSDKQTEEQLQLGSARKLYGYGTARMSGAGAVDVTLCYETPQCQYPTVQENFPLTNPQSDDVNINMNETGNALFTQFQVDGKVGSYFNLTRYVLEVGRDPWLPVSGR